MITFELVEEDAQGGGQVQLVDVDDDVDHIAAIDEPLVHVVVDDLLGRRRGLQVDQTGTVHDGHLCKGTREGRSVGSFSGVPVLP